jgi:hypothetical protein
MAARCNDLHHGAACSALSAAAVRANQLPRAVNRADALPWRTLSVSMPSRPRSATVPPETGLSPALADGVVQTPHCCKDCSRSSRQSGRPASQATEWLLERGAHHQKPLSSQPGQRCPLTVSSRGAGILFPPPAEEQLPSAPPMLRVMHDHSSGNTGNYDQEGREHDGLSLQSAGQSSARQSHADRSRSGFGSTEPFGL